MIIVIEGSDAIEVAAARQDLDALVAGWGYRLDDHSAEVPITDDDRERRADPVAVAALIASVPSAALAALDLADRIIKRRRARDLIEHVGRASTRRVTVRLISNERSVEIVTLNPDSLLDLVDDRSDPLEDV